MEEYVLLKLSHYENGNCHDCGRGEIVHKQVTLKELIADLSQNELKELGLMRIKESGDKFYVLNILYEKYNEEFDEQEVEEVDLNNINEDVVFKLAKNIPLVKFLLPENILSNNDIDKINEQKRKNQIYKAKIFSRINKMPKKRRDKLKKLCE